jgi:hypothetical protein
MNVEITLKSVLTFSACVIGYHFVEVALVGIGMQKTLKAQREQKVELA